MSKKYIGAWAVFDEDYDEGLEVAFARYRQAGIEHIMYAGIAHTFPIHPQYYSGSCIDPQLQINFEQYVGDVFGTKKNLIDADFQQMQRLAEGYGLSLDFDITPGVSEVIVEAYPHTAVVDVQGERSKHWLCPSNPDVQAYSYGRTLDILENNPGIREVELDVISLDFYDPQVVPDWVPPELYPLRQLAAGNCFCEHCIQKATQAGIDVEAMRREILSIYKEATTLTYESFKNQADAYRGLFDIVRFLIRHPRLIDWMSFRARVVGDFVRGCHRLVKGFSPDILLSNDLVSPSFSWTLGQLYHDQPPMTDMTKLMLYHKNIGGFESKPLRRIQQAVPAITDAELLDQYYRLKGFSGPLQMDALAQEGIGVENIYYEMRKAKLEVGMGHPVIAGLAADPPASPEDVRQAVRMAHKGGADGYMLHLWYRNAPKENIIAFGEQLRELGEV